MKTFTRQKHKSSLFQNNKENQDEPNPEPFKFPEFTARQEADTFNILLKYDSIKKKYYWFAYRIAEAEKKSKYMKKNDKSIAGVVILWGIYLPFCKNSERECMCLKDGHMAKEMSYFVTGELNINCALDRHGETKIKGTCLSKGSYYKYFLLKEGQEYKVVATYINSRKHQNEILKSNIFDYSINKDSLEFFGQNLICDFMLSFTTMTENDPMAKLKFDELIARNLYCPSKPEKCAPYVQNKDNYKNGLKAEYERISNLGIHNFDKVNKFNDDNLSYNDKDFYSDHISPELRFGKNCRVLLDDDDEYQTAFYSPKNKQIFDVTEDIPQYKPSKKFGLVKLKPGEFSEISRNYKGDILSKETMRKIALERKI